MPGERGGQSSEPTPWKGNPLLSKYNGKVLHHAERNSLATLALILSNASFARPCRLKTFRKNNFLARFGFCFFFHEENTRLLTSVLLIQ